MTKQNTIWPEIAATVFANPFSDRQQELNARLAGCPADLPPEEIRRRRDQAILRHVAELVRAKADDVRQYTGPDQPMMRTVLLFDAFIRFADQFDQLIQDQIRAGDEPCPVPFASELITLLTRRGFTAVERRRFIAIFYQLRRAYYFITQDLTGPSPCMRDLRYRLWNSVVTQDIRWYDTYLWNRMEDFSTLLLGETGTGKGTAAAAIGRAGFIPFDPRRGVFTESFTRSFISLNLSEHPEALVESELFGHRKGAFTGAVEEHEGILARSSPHGAIFLDEIGDVPVPIQIKLLRVLQERTFSPVGSHEKRRCQGRILAATNHPLDELRASGRFRDDFYYRLSSDIITVPPLRQRIAEDPQELDELLARVVARLTGQPGDDLVAVVQQAIVGGVGRDYAWPGNVRELEQATRRVLVSGAYQGDRAAVAPDLATRLRHGIIAGDIEAETLLAGYCAMLYERHGTYEEVARRTGLDRRTAKAHIERHARAPGEPGYS